MEFLKGIIERTDTKAGKAFDLFIQFLILLSLITFSIETLPDLSENQKHILWVIEVLTVIIFTVEYILRIIVADKKLKFIFSIQGFIDLLAILPFYIRLGIDLRTIRLFRLFRLIRIFKFFRYSRAVKRFKSTFRIVKAELILFSISTLFLLYLSAVGIYYFENQAQPENFGSVFHSLWWAVATLTTVGYGDVFPITMGGKIFTFIILMLGLGIIAVPAGLLSSALTKTLDKEREKSL